MYLMYCSQLTELLISIVWIYKYNVYLSTLMCAKSYHSLYIQINETHCSIQSQVINKYIYIVQQQHIYMWSFYHKHFSMHVRMKH